MMPGSDVDTIANAAELWKLVHDVQDLLRRDGTVKIKGDRVPAALAHLRKLADELDPDYMRGME